jgi:glycosyltransferase involved in cell wall biosynthesis
MSTPANSLLHSSADLFGHRRLRIAMLAPPWISVPPAGYGGIESVVSLLSNELVRRGHFVTLFCAPGSRGQADLRPLLSEAHPERIGEALFEADHVARAFAVVQAEAASGRPFDVLHDHCGFTALAMADSLAVPVVHTIHGEFNRHTERFYAWHGNKAALVAISRAQLASAPAGGNPIEVISNPIDVSDWPLESQKDGYLLWIGRMAEVKGPHRAIDVARRVGLPLVLAGPVQAGQQAFFDAEITPQIDGRRVSYVGEVGGNAKKRLFSRATALLMPIRWPEPFGMVMIEALACGTPVIAFPDGAASEVVQHGRNGFLVADEREMARAVDRLARIDPRACRASVSSRYGVGAVAARYEALYRRVCGQPGWAPGLEVVALQGRAEAAL